MVNFMHETSSKSRSVETRERHFAYFYIYVPMETTACEEFRFPKVHGAAEKWRNNKNHELKHLKALE